MILENKLKQQSGELNDTENDVESKSKKEPSKKKPDSKEVLSDEVSDDSDEEDLYTETD